MKRKSSLQLGPGASSLILIFVVLAMSVLGMLFLMNSHSDLRLSQRSAQVIEAVYALNAQAEEKRAQLDAIVLAAAPADTEERYLAAIESALPEGVTLEDGVLRWEITDGSRALDCALEILPRGGEVRTQWITYDLTAVTEEDW